MADKKVNNTKKTSQATKKTNNKKKVQSKKASTNINKKISQEPKKINNKKKVQNKKTSSNKNIESKSTTEKIVVKSKSNIKKRITILVIMILAILIALISATYAYFSANITKENENNNELSSNTKLFVNATMELGDKIESNGVFPGYKVIKTIHVTGSGPSDAESVVGNIVLTPNVTDFSDHVKYTLYKQSGENVPDGKNICESENKKQEDNKYFDDMKCDTTSLGEPIKSGIFNGTDLVENEIIITNETNDTYYLLIEYVNADTDQSNEAGKSFEVSIGFSQEYNNAILTYKVEGKTATAIPQKGDYIVEVDCKDTAVARWNRDTWELEITEKKEERVVCSVEFITPTLATEFEEIAENSPDLLVDETADKNLRYVGENPKNYVSFNGELWRIIGVMNNVSDSEGNVASRVKIIRNESIGSYSWDYNPNEYPQTTNDWSESTLKDLLNSGVYYNRTTGTYYNNSTTATNVDFKNNGLTEESKNMISNVVWNLGGTTYKSNLTSNDFYKLERETQTYGTNSSKWVGKVGLVYGSDYGLAMGDMLYSANSKCTSAKITVVNGIDSTLAISCYSKVWLYKDLGWLLNVDSNNNSYTKGIWNSSSNLNGGIYDYTARTILSVKPVVYLKPELEIVDGTGDINNPYILNFKE